MDLISEIISENNTAPVIVLYGGSPHRRHQVIMSLSQLGDITVYGALNEEGGNIMVEDLPKVDLVLIGGAYTEDERVRIKQLLRLKRPNTKITEPGKSYIYSDANIRADVKPKLYI